MRRREAVAFWIALGMLGAVAALAYRSIVGTATTLDLVEHTHQILSEFDELNGAYARAASARRAYAIAGDASQLGALASLDARVTTSIAKLHALFADNPTQLTRLDLFTKLIHQRFVTLDQANERRRAGGVGGETPEGLVQVAQIRSTREQMEAEENRLLFERDARTRSDVERTKLVEIFGTGGSFVILLLAFRRLRQEIGKRTQSEEALQRANGFLDSIVENIPDMVFVKEARALRFERINRAGEELLGVQRADLIGKNDYDFFPEEQADAFQARDREALVSGHSVDIAEETIVTKQGERWLHTKKVPILDKRGAPQYLLGISEDITDRRLAAELLKTAKESAEAANEELEAFSYSVAHDLRAPLRSIDGFSQALQEDCGDKLDASGIKHLNRVRAAAQHMGHIIDGLLSLSKVTRGELAREEVDLGELARGSIARLRAAQPERKVEAVIADDLVVDGDPRLLAAALDNLIGNAWKFTGKAEHARIEVGKTGNTFFVKDNGAGFDQSYVKKLFGAFQRLHLSSEFEGSGIGLATVQRIVRRHGGTIRAEGQVGQGATFYFALSSES